MKQAPLVTDLQIEQTIATIPEDAFTIFDFIRTFADLSSADWSNLVAAFGERSDGMRRSYTAATPAERAMGAEAIVRVYRKRTSE